MQLRSQSSQYFMRTKSLCTPLNSKLNEKSSLGKASVFTSTQSAEIVDEPFNCRKLLERCSNLQTVRGVITRVRRFIALLKSRVRKNEAPNMSGPLTVLEVNYADLLLCRATQQQLLAKEVDALRDDKKLPKGSMLRDLPCLLYTSPSPRDS